MEGLQVTKFVFRYSNGYLEVYRRFQGDFFCWERGVKWEDLSMEEFILEEENLHEGERRIF